MTITMATLACAAGILGAPTPDVMPIDMVVPHEEISGGWCATGKRGCYNRASMTIIRPAGEIRDTIRPHEVFHHIQNTAGLYPHSKVQRESQADWATRRFHRECPGV